MTTRFAKKHLSAKSLEIFPQINIEKSSLDLIKEYLLSQQEQIRNFEKINNSIYETISNFIEITKDYSNQLEILALKIIPNYSTEGQLAQAVQGILLFYSEGLNNLISELKVEKAKIKEDEINNILKKYDEYKIAFFQKIKETNLSFSKFENEIESYQEYLVNEEYKKHLNKSDFKNYDDEIIYINDNSKNDNKGNNIDESFDVIDAAYINDMLDNLYNQKDNEKEVIESQKILFSNINESNEILKNIKKFLSKEKTNLRQNLFNLCDSLIEGLLKCAKAQKENYNIQNEVIQKLINILKFEEKDKNRILPSPVKLKYLEIYKNYINEKSDLNNNKKPNLTTDDLYNNMPKLNYNMGDDTNDLTRYTMAYSQTGNLFLKDKKLEKLKSKVIKLNRSEIIKIFEKIKDTDIKLDESDINIIEQEINYKKIHDILISIFINTEKYTEEDKNILLKFFEKDKIYIIYFIKILNDHRTKGKFILSEKTLKYLGELFKYINNLILSKNDMELFKYIFILSMTYYHLSESNNKKIFLFSYIKDHPQYQKVAFWDDYLYELIDHDLKGNSCNINLVNKNLEQLNKEDKEKLINCYFSNFLTVVKAMADFRMDKQFVKDFLEKNKEKYILSKEQIDNICMIFDISSNDNEIYYTGDFLDKEKQNKSKDENNEKDKKQDGIDNNKNNENINKENENKNDINDNNLENKDEKEKLNDEKEEKYEKHKNIDKNDINFENNIEFDNENNQTNNETI